MQNMSYFKNSSNAIFYFLVLITVLMFAGCGTQDRKKIVDAKYILGIGDYKNLEFAVKTFSAGVDECLLDVRDRGLTWEQSRNCLALGVLSKAYINAGGQTPDEPSYINALGNDAVSRAWAAKAGSCLGGGMQFLW